MKQIALIGSSGGNLYNLGGNEPIQMLQEIINQAAATEIKLTDVVFVGANTSMDNITNSTKAALYTMENEQLFAGEQVGLEQANEQAREADKKLARKISNGEIDGLILLSCDPKNVNQASVAAAVQANIPAVGTGGTSVATAQSAGLRVISASGTTGTTNRTRAVAFISAFSSEWKLKFMPVIGKSAAGTFEKQSVFKRFKFQGIMMAALPGFIAMALCLALSKIPGLGNLEQIFSLLVETLPVILATIAAKQVSGLDEVGIVSGIVAGIMSRGGGVIGGLLSGFIAGAFSYYIISFCFSKKFPGTTSNIAAGGLGGLAAGFVGMLIIEPAALFCGNTIQNIITFALEFNPILAGIVAGALMWPAVLGGVYHAALLPIILLEMELTGYSFIGALDVIGLGCVAAGITLANVICPKQKGDVAVAAPGLFILIVFGTFVESAYPFMFSSKKVFATAILSATFGGFLVGLFGVKTMGYVPLLLTPTLAPAGKALFCALAIVATIAFSCILTIICNQMDKKKVQNA